MKHYAGLSIEHEPALLDAKAEGAEWVARDHDRLLYGYATMPSKLVEAGIWISDDVFELDCDGQLKFVKWSQPEPVNLDLALAQIAEMKAEIKPMTWNDRINQMTVEEKAKSICDGEIDDFWARSIDACMLANTKTAEEYHAMRTQMWIYFLNSPYAANDEKGGGENG